MKIVITITAAEISQLIQHHLAKKGMEVNIEDIKYAKGSATVMADSPMDVSPDVPAPVDERAPPRAEVSTPYVVPATTTPPGPPVLEAIEGGAGSVDMTAIFRESQKIAASTEGKFPTPKHNMLDGESSEWPGDKS